MAGNRQTDTTVRDNQTANTTAYDSHSFRDVELNEADVRQLIIDAVIPMAGPDLQTFDVSAVYSELDGKSLDDTDAKMLSILLENGQINPEDIAKYADMSDKAQSDYMADQLKTWLDDPNATGKDTILANLETQYLLGYDEGSTLDILDLQSADVLLGSTPDGHVNTFFYNNVNGQALYNVDQIMAEMADPNGTMRSDVSAIDEDVYLDACDSWRSKMLSMCGMGNNVQEMIAGADALRLKFDADYPGETPEGVMEEMCKEQGWNYEEFMKRMNNPDPNNKDAYRNPLVNGELPQDYMKDDEKGRKVRMAYSTLLAENIVGGPDVDEETRKENAKEANDLMRKALTAGIDAFRDVLQQSELGQKLLEFCNHIVHSPPINGTLFQEIWDLDKAETKSTTYTRTTTPTITPSTTGKQDDVETTGKQDDVETTGKQDDVETTGKQDDVETTGKQDDPPVTTGRQDDPPVTTGRQDDPPVTTSKQKDDTTTTAKEDDTTTTAKEDDTTTTAKEDDTTTTAKEDDTTTTQEESKETTSDSANNTSANNQLENAGSGDDEAAKAAMLNQNNGEGPGDGVGTLQGTDGVDENNVSINDFKNIEENTGDPFAQGAAGEGSGTPEEGETPSIQAAADDSSAAAPAATETPAEAAPVVQEENKHEEVSATTTGVSDAGLENVV